MLSPSGTNLLKIGISSTGARFASSTLNTIKAAATQIHQLSGCQRSKGIHQLEQRQAQRRPDQQALELVGNPAS